MKTIRNIFFFAGLALLLWSPAATATASGAPSPELVNQVIDGRIAFYGNRVHLAGSPYTILADIGCDAVAKVKWLNNNRSALVKEALTDRGGRKAKSRTEKIRTFLSKRMNTRREALSKRICLEYSLEMSPMVSAATSPE